MTIEFNPIKRYSVSFTYPLETTWQGAVLVFDSSDEHDTIYPSSVGNIGLWLVVEHLPRIATS